MKTPSQKGRASRSKGKVGERELANLLTAKGFPAQRAQQFKGGQHSDDIWCPRLRGLGFLIEAKRTETVRLTEWLAKAREDAAGRDPLICWRKNGGEWIAVLPLDALLGLIDPTSRLDPEARALLTGGPHGS